MSHILVIVYKPGCPAQSEVIANDLEAMQAIVGGYLEVVQLPVPELCIVCNEEGLIHNLPMNRLGLRGSFFVARSDESGDFVSLTDDDTVLIPQLLSAAVQQIDA